MARPQLTGPGQQRLQALEDAMAQMGLLHSIVERMALAFKNQQPLQPFGQQLRRAAPPIADLLKGQYGTIADQITQLTLVATRGGGDRAKITALREGVAGVKASIEIAQRKVFEQFAVEERRE